MDSFSQPINLTNKLSWIPDYRISANGKNVYVVWNENYENLVFARSNDNGAGFRPPVSITKVQSLEPDPIRYELEISNNNLYVVSLGIITQRVPKMKYCLLEVLIMELVLKIQRK